MRAVDIISKKRDGGELSKAEIEFFIQGFATGEVTDYQASAWAMAVVLNGMNGRESTDLTMAMVNSGETLDLSGVVPLAVDKHSTGGVGDKTTLVVEPTVAACGVPVAKMSGRGLGFSGGTLDKMESIPGFQVEISAEQFLNQLEEVGVVLSGQTADLAPADGKLYALRDVTGTIPSIPLIASSVMSKKIAAGAQAIVLDVKVGVGAFMKTLDEARELAELMVEIGRRAGRRVVALLAEMNQPLGLAIGNSLEVKEAVNTLRGDGPADFEGHWLEVAGHMLRLAGAAEDLETGKACAKAAIEDGSALAKFRALVAAQGGDPTYVDDPSQFPEAQFLETASASQDGYIAQIHAAEVGYALIDLGGGRAKKGDPIDHAVGIVLHQKVGDMVSNADPLFTVHANDRDRLAAVQERIHAAISYSDQPVDPPPLFYDVIES
jgi:pyrimidine-nucleoside phosphorylase